MISKKIQSDDDDDLTKKHSPLQDEQKYMLAVICAHGAYDKNALPLTVHKYASKSLQTLKSTPKLITFTNSSPGNVVLGDADGSDNAKLTDYFKKHRDINLMADTNQNTKKQMYLSKHKKTGENKINKNSFDVEIITYENLAHTYDAIILAVPHQQILTSINFESYKNAGAFIYDVKGILPKALIDGRL